VSDGCHNLIRNGAALVRNIDDILVELDWAPEISLFPQDVMDTGLRRVSVRRLDKPRKMLLDALGFEPASIDDLIARTGHTAKDIAIRLTTLELEGLVEMLPGGRYGRLPQADRKVN